MALVGNSGGGSSRDSKVAPVQWAQRLRWLFITVPVIDIVPQSASVQIRNTQQEGTQVSELAVAFQTAQGVSYAEKLELFDLVKPFDEVPPRGNGADTHSRFSISGRSIQVRLGRVNPGSYWPRLTSKPLKKSTLKPDWGKWKDEDEVKEEEEDQEAAEFAKTALNSSSMGDGLSISGSGDPAKIAQMQQEYLAQHSQ